MYVCIETYVQLGMIIPVLFANQISVVENRLQTGFRLYWPPKKFIFQAHINLVLHGFFASHISLFD